MSFPRDAILGTGFAPQGRASPIAPNARPIYNKRESPIRTIGDLLRVQLPYLWPKIQANCAKMSCEDRTAWDSLDTPIANYGEYRARRLLAFIFDWAETPEGYEFWMNESRQ